jgi:hypothetical protein
MIIKKLHQNKCFCEKLFNEHDVLCASLTGQHIWVMHMELTNIILLQLLSPIFFATL